jgi:hypothetical protein
MLPLKSNIYNDIGHFENPNVRIFVLRITILLDFILTCYSCWAVHTQQNYLYYLKRTKFLFFRQSQVSSSIFLIRPFCPPTKTHPHRLIKNLQLKTSAYHRQAILMEIHCIPTIKGLPQSRNLRIGHAVTPFSHIPPFPKNVFENSSARIKEGYVRRLLSKISLKLSQLFASFPSRNLLQTREIYCPSGHGGARGLSGRGGEREAVRGGARRLGRHLPEGCWRATLGRPRR